MRIATIVAGLMLCTNAIAQTASERAAILLSSTDAELMQSIKVDYLSGLTAIPKLNTPIDIAKLPAESNKIPLVSDNPNSAIIAAAAGVAITSILTGYVSFLDSGDTLSKVWVSAKDAGTSTEAEEWAFRDTYRRMQYAAGKLGMAMECENDCRPAYRFDGEGRRFLKFTTASDTWWMTWYSGKFVESLPSAARDAALGFVPSYETDGMRGWRFRLEGRALGLLPVPLKQAWKETPWKEFMQYVTDNNSNIYITPGKEIYCAGEHLSGDALP